MKYYPSLQLKGMKIFLLLELKVQKKLQIADFTKQAFWPHLEVF